MSGQTGCIRGESWVMPVGICFLFMLYCVAFRGISSKAYSSTKARCINKSHSSWGWVQYTLECFVAQLSNCCRITPALATRLYRYVPTEVVWHAA